MFLFSFSKNSVTMYPFTTIIPFISLETEKFLASFVIFAGNPESRDLLVDQYSDLIPIIRMPERIFDFPFQRVYTYINLN